LIKEERGQAVQRSVTAIMNNQGMTHQYRVILKSGEEATLEVTTTLLRDE